MLKRIFFYLILLIISIIPSCSDVNKKYIEGDPFVKPDIYHSPDELLAALTQIQTSHSDITRLKTIGYSVKGKPILAFIITDNPDINEIDEPRIRLSGSIHGNEYISGEILIRLIKYLTDNYNVDSTVTSLVNTRYISIIPMINPDGVDSSTRNNARNVDLNRNFSYAWAAGYDHGSSAFSEPESKAVRDYSLEKVFHLSATYHSGTVVVNMPFDYGSESSGTVPVENGLVKYLGLVYSMAGTFLSNPDILVWPPYVISGTVNGGDWYIVNGSLQDWSYMESGCLDFTIEVADTSPLADAGIEEVFLYNRGSILAYIDSAGLGVYGKVTGTGSNPVIGAKIFINDGISDGDLQTLSDVDGYYFKILKNGTYTLKVSATGYGIHSQSITISGTVLRLDIQL